MNSVDAKEFLISRVVEEARIEGIQLSEIERKMLYFTESHPSLPDIYEVNEKFESEYDDDEYEAKIVDLLKNARKRDKKDDQQWKDALKALSQEDHYILVMTDVAFG